MNPILKIITDLKDKATEEIKLAHKNGNESFQTYQNGKIDMANEILDAIKGE